MVEFAILLTLACAEPEIVNQSRYPLNDRDYEVCLNIVTKRCKYHYPRLPCAKRCIKTDEHDYRVYCGGVDA